MTPRTEPRPRRPRRHAFSLIELVMVIAILGVVAAIAVPRLSNAAGNASASALAADVEVLNKAADMYAAEHNQQTIAQEPNGSSTTDPAVITQRLLRQTADSGAFTGPAIYGPYLRAIPTNPMNGKKTIRIGLGNIASNAAGWVFDPSANSFSSDARGVLTVDGHGEAEDAGQSGVSADP